MDIIEIFGKKIPVYGALGLFGVLLGILYLRLACHRRKKSFEDSIYILIWACIMAMIGAKLLYILLEAKNIVVLIKAHSNQVKDIALDYLAGGFVFYGGLFGAIAGVVWGAKYFSLNVMEELNLCIPIMPLVHGFGRIGCHLVGCCYGIEYSGPLARVYSHSTYAPIDVGLFPVQLVESLFDFLLFVVLVSLEIGWKYESKKVIVYLLSYASVRFILEFFRGDAYRGMFAGLSTSQWISLFIVLFVIIKIASKENGKTSHNNS